MVDFAYLVLPLILAKRGILIVQFVKMALLIMVLAVSVHTRLLMERVFTHLVVIKDWIKTRVVMMGIQ